MHFTSLFFTIICACSAGTPAQARLTAPTATCSLLTTAVPTIAATGSAAEGTPPYTYRLYRSRNCNLNTNAPVPVLANDPTAVLLETQAGLKSNIPPRAYTDSSAPAGMEFYSWVVTDSEQVPQTVAGINVGVVVPAPGPNVHVLAIGDSIGLGHDGSKFIQQIVNIQVTAPGSGYTTATAVIPPPSGPNGVQATAVCHIANKQIDYIYWTNPGWGYNVETPLPVTITGDGTGAMAVANPGGGCVLACQQILQEQYGYKTVSVFNCCVGGTASYSWWPFSASKHHYTDAARATVGSPLETPTIVYVRFGANDSVSFTSPSEFKSNMEELISDYLTWGAQIVVLDPPLWWPGAGSPQQQYLIQQYGAVCQTLSQANPRHVLFTGSSNYSFFYAHPEHMFVDDVHPVDSGYAIMGAVMANVLVPLISLTPPEPPPHAPPFR